METDLLDVLEAICDGTVDRTPIVWSQNAAVGVVQASGGYPDAYTTGHPIAGLDDVDNRRGRLPRGDVA